VDLKSSYEVAKQIISNQQVRGHKNTRTNFEIPLLMNQSI
jgi:hypothetical protein